MDDILLTKNEAFKAVSQGMENWDVAGRPLNQSMWYEQQALCRAQVRKVYKWLQNETEPRDPSHYWLGARRMLDDKTLCALREAAGEGK